MNDLEKRQKQQDELLYAVAKADIKERYRKAKKDCDKLERAEVGRRKAGLPE